MIVPSNSQGVCRGSSDNTRSLPRQFPRSVTRIRIGVTLIAVPMSLCSCSALLEKWPFGHVDSLTKSQIAEIDAKLNAALIVAGIQYRSEAVKVAGQGRRGQVWVEHWIDGEWVEGARPNESHFSFPSSTTVTVDVAVREVDANSGKLILFVTLRECGFWFSEPIELPPRSTRPCVLRFAGSNLSVDEGNGAFVAGVFRKYVVTEHFDQRQFMGARDELPIPEIFVVRIAFAE